MAKEFLQKFAASSDFSEQDLKSQISSLESMKMKKMEEQGQLAQQIEEIKSEVETNQRMEDAKKQEHTSIEIRLKVLEKNLTELQSKH